MSTSKCFLQTLVFIAVVVVALSGCDNPTPTPTSTPGPTPTSGPGTPTPEPPTIVQNEQFGIAWSADFRIRKTPYPPTGSAADNGAKWDRWTFEWSRIEYDTTSQEPVFVKDPYDVFAESWNYDSVIQNDQSAGLEILGVLNGMPEPKYYLGASDGRGSIQGLDEDIFVNGDTSTPNPENPWAYFLYRTTAQYAAPVRAWEIGNETDDISLGHRNFPLTADAYVKALKIACTVIHVTDPGAPIVLGSVRDVEANVALSQLNNTQSTSFYAQLLQAIKRDDTARGCLTSIALHAYGDPPFSYQLVTTIGNYLPGTDVWLTEVGKFHPTSEKNNGVPIIPNDGVTDDVINCYTTHPCGTTANQASYIIQQFATALQGFKEINRLDGKMFLHRLMDETGDDGPWGLIQRDTRTRWPSYWAAMLASQKLNGAVFDNEANSVPAQGYHQLTFRKGTDKLHVVWGADENTCVVASEKEAAYAFTQESFWPTNQTPVGWKRNYEYKPQGVLVRAIKQSERSCFSLIDIGEHIVSSHAYILVESTESSDALPPLGGVVLLADKCSKPDKMLVTGYDDPAGLNKLIVNSDTGPHAFDLSWLPSRNLYMYVTTTIPAIGQTWAYNLTDKVGNATVGSVTNKGAPTCPGGDEPDDNFSAATSASLSDGFTLINGAQQLPRVAILNNGFAANVLQLLLSLNEPAIFVESDFDPAATYQQFQTLIIPSGGLYGLGNSATFRARLEEYARLGGTILAFDQQHGTDYTALPGGRVGGYGWQEDISCFVNAFYLAQYHPVLAGFDHPRLNVHADGYFKTWPQDAQILLRRSVNGMPGAIIYPFGAGRVFATTIYDDWGIDNGQLGEDARILLRDLIAWSSAPDELPTFKIDETVSLSIPVTNTTGITATNARLELITPARDITLTQTITVEIGPDQSVSIPFTTTVALPLGLWRVDVTLLNGSTEIGSPKSETVFAVIDPPASIAPDHDLTLSVSAPQDTYIRWSDVTFTFTVTNRSALDQSATVRYKLPAHTWVGVSGVNYGNQQPLSQTLSVLANSTATFTWTVPVVTPDTVWAEISENGAQAWFNLFSTQPKIALTADLIDPPPYYSGQPTAIVVTVTNDSPVVVRPRWNVQAYLIPDTMGMYRESLLSEWQTVAVPAATLDAGGQLKPGGLTTTLPFTPTAASRQYALFGGLLPTELTRRIYLNVYIPAPLASYSTNILLTGPLGVSAQPNDPWIPGQNGSLAVNVTNTLPTTSLTGTVTATLMDPQGAVIVSQGQPFQLAAAHAVTQNFQLALPSALLTGVYQLQVAATAGAEAFTRTLSLPFEPRSQSFEFDRPVYQAGQDVTLTVHLDNPGIFQPALTLEAQSPDLAYSASQVVTLLAQGEATAIFSLTLPFDLTSGTYPITLTHLVAGNNAGSQTAALQVGPPDLRVQLESVAVRAGELVTVTLSNVGGATAHAAYGLELYDPQNQGRASMAGAIDPIHAGETDVITLTVPAESLSGMYLVRGYVSEEHTNRSQSVLLPVTVQGLQVELSASAEHDIYGANRPITVVVGMTNTGLALTDALLDIRVAQPTSLWHWTTFRSPIDPVPGNYFNDLMNDLAVDPQGHLWIATYDYGGAAVLDDGHTSFDKSDDQWQTFNTVDGLSHSELTRMAIDPAGRKWFGTWHHGVNVLNDNGTPFDKSDDQWANFHVSDDSTQDSVSDVAVDAQNRLWLTANFGVRVLDHNGTPFDPTDDITQTFAVGEGLNGSPMDMVIDPAGRKWIGLYHAGVSVLDDHGTWLDKSDDQWITFTAADGLADDIVWQVVIDAQGRKWLSTDAGISVLDDNNTPFDKSDDLWQTFTDADGLLSNTTRVIWAESQDRKWIGTSAGLSILDDNGTPFDKSDDLWEAYTPADGLASPEVRTITAGSSGQAVWIGTSDGLSVVDRVADDAGGYWQADQSVSLAEGQAMTLTLPTGLLAQSGKFRIEARLSADDGRVIARSQESFYRFLQLNLTAWRSMGLAAFNRQAATTPLAVTLTASPLLTRPSQTIALTGTIRNFDVSSHARLVNIYQAGTDIFATGVITLGPGEAYTFTTSTTAPAAAGLSVLEIRSTDVEGNDAVSAQDVAQVMVPVLQAEVQAPSIVGREPFSMTVLIRNLSAIDGQVQVNLANEVQMLSVPAGEVRAAQFAAQIDHDTSYVIEISGDLQQTLDYTALVGENVTVQFVPQARYATGRVEIPYQLNNVGQRDVQLSTVITLTAAEVITRFTMLESFVPTGATMDGSLAFDDLPAGEYTLSYSTPYQTEMQSVPVSVGQAEAVELALTKEVSAGSLLTITAALTNTGVNSLNGLLLMDGDLGAEAITLTLDPGVAALYPLPVDLTGAAQHEPIITVTVYNDRAQVLATQTLTLAVKGPQIVLSAVPTGVELSAGQIVTLPFVVENQGDQAGPTELTLDFADFSNETQHAWLEPGQKSELAFSFYLPDDLVSGSYLARYALSAADGTTGSDLLISINGISVSVEATPDAPYYHTGDLAGITLTVTNEANNTASPLYALARFNNAVVTQSLTFADSTAIAHFNLPVRFDGDAKVFYSIYQQTTDRAIHLNTLYLYEADSDLSLTTDRQVYRPGDTVFASLFTTATGQLTIDAPGYQQTLALPAAGFQFDLPLALTRGTYEIRYQLTGCGCALEGRTRVHRIDVDAVQIKVTSATVALQPSTSHPLTASLGLNISASEVQSAVVQAWISSSGGPRNPVTQSISLAAISNNVASVPVSLESIGLGSQELVYFLVQPDNPDLVYAAGTATLDLGQVSMLGVHVSTDYPHTTDSVVVEATLYASRATAADLTLNVDGVLAVQEGRSLAPGTQTIHVTLPGSLQPGWHDLSVGLASNGLTTTSSALRFAYGTQAADLVVSQPRLTVATSGVTGTLEVFVRNAGGEDVVPTTINFWGGAPSAGGVLITQVSVPALEAGAGNWVQTIWNLQDQGGSHTLYVAADAASQVTEFYENNNTSSGAVDVPGFALQLAADRTGYDPGQTVSLTVSATNLRVDRAVNLVITTTAEYQSDTPTFTDSRDLAVSAGGEAQVTIPWNTGEAPGGLYTLRVVAREGDEQRTAYTSIRVHDYANFVATPVSGTAPLTVTFSDLSTPFGGISAWQWDFGDELTSTLQNPSHVYLQAGTYTITLTTWTGSDIYTKTRATYVVVTETTSSLPVAFPSTLILDDFNRSDGPLNDIWAGGIANYEVSSQQLTVSQVYGGDIFWVAAQYSADQEAFVTLSSVDTDSGSPALLLKVGVGRQINVSYDAAQQQVLVQTYDAAQGWVQYGSAIPVTLFDGDQLGARVTAAGQVNVYSNGELLATRDVSTWPYATREGYLGLSLDTDTVGLDDFGGGSVNTLSPAAECPCSLWRDTSLPAESAVGDSDPVELGVRFESKADGYITGLRFYKGETNIGTHVGHLWTLDGKLLASATYTDETSSGWQTVTFPYPVAIVSNTVYVASYYAPAGHFAVTRNYFTAAYEHTPLRALVTTELTGGNGVFRYPKGIPNQSYMDSNYWVDVIFDVTPPSITSDPFTLWDDTTTPVISAAGDANPIELGVRFESQVDGYLTGLRFYKGEGNTGTHLGHLWAIDGTLLATATFTSETTSGWQTVAFSSPVAIVSNTVYVASYYAPAGHYAVTSDYFDAAYARPPLRAPATTEIAGGNGVYAYFGGFPTNSYVSTNYWVDVVFQIALSPTMSSSVLSSPMIADVDDPVSSLTDGAPSVSRQFGSGYISAGDHTV